MKGRAIYLVYGLILMFWGAGPTTPLFADEMASIPENTVAALLRDPGTPIVGGHNADVTLVEYSDYNCPYCKTLSPALHALLASDPKVALVYKDWPILSDVSVYAAGLALAAGWQGKYLAAHDTLMAASRLSSDAQVDSLLQGARIDMDVLKKDREAHSAEIKTLLQRNDTEAKALRIRGTPGLLIGRHLVNGVYDVTGLQQVVATARRDRQ